MIAQIKTTARSKADYSLCLVTDRAILSAPTLAEAVEQGIAGGVTMVQLREKNAPGSEIYALAVELKAICDKSGIPLIINDRADIALAVGAAGVHVGQSDLPARAVRRMLGEACILGVSATSVQEAVQAQADGADYIGVGAMVPTGSKADAKIVDLETLAAIRAAVSIPVMVIGGLNAGNLPPFMHVGADGVAVISAILAQADIRSAAADIRGVIEQNK